MKEFNYVEYITNNPLLKEEQRRGENLQQIIDYFIQDVNRGTELTELQKAFILIKRNELLAGTYTGEEAKLQYMKLINDLGSENKEVAAKAMEQFDIFILPADRISDIWNDLSTTFNVANLGTPPEKPADRDVQGYLDMLIQGAGDMMQGIKDYISKVYEYFKDGNTYMKKQAELDKDSTFSNYAESAELIADLIGVSKEVLKYFIPVIIAIAFFLYRVLGVGKGSGKKWYPSKARKDYEDTDPDSFSQGQIFEQDEYKNEIKQYFKNIFLPFAKKLVEYFLGLSLKLKAKFLHSIVKATKSNDESKLNAVLPDEIMPEYNKVVNYLKGEKVNEELSEITLTNVIFLGGLINAVVNTVHKIMNGVTVPERYISNPELAYSAAKKAKKSKRKLKNVMKDVAKAMFILEDVLEMTREVVKADTQEIEDAIVIANKKISKDLSLEIFDEYTRKVIANAELLGKLHRRLQNEINTVDVDVKTLEEGELEDKQQDALSTIDKVLKQIEKLTKMYRDTEND